MQYGIGVTIIIRLGFVYESDMYMIGVCIIWELNSCICWPSPSNQVISKLRVMLMIISRGGQMGAKEPIVAPPGFLVALGYDLTTYYTKQPP